MPSPPMIPTRWANVGSLHEKTAHAGVDGEANAGTAFAYGMTITVVELVTIIGRQDSRARRGVTTKPVVAAVRAGTRGRPARSRRRIRRPPPCGRARKAPRKE